MRNLASVLIITLLGVGIASDSKAADHGDTPFLTSEGRHDARITDFYAFSRGDNLVVVVDMNPAIPNSVQSYMFPSDLTVDINIDNNSPVSSEDPSGQLGGTLLDPEGIQADITYRVTFGDDGQPTVHTVPGHGPQPSNVFIGLRDDPFIRAPRTGRNVAAIVIEVPLAAVQADQSTLLLWATADLDGAGQVELGARALRNQFPENICMNDVHPRNHERVCDLSPADVVIYDTDYAAAYPNGRDLPDDVLDLVGDPRPLRNDDPFPSENDVPFLSSFPYLAPPHQ